MAWNPLPTNYTDAVWSGNRRYVMINNEDGTVSFQDVTVYNQHENSFFGALDANRMNEAMNTIMANLETVTYDGAGAHNAVYRGKYFGEVVTPQQYAAIANGSFTDLYIGDFWVINGVVWRIAAFDYYLRTGDNTDLQTHHIVIVPDATIIAAPMNATNTNSGGYANSLMRTTNLEQEICCKG